MNMIEIILKLFLAIALGGLIGLERESSHKPAGFRTHILICMGSAMMMILSMLLVQEEVFSQSDLSRIAAGVITGIGFIGAGTIIQARGSVIGLTTAATLWAVAGLGLVIGAGYYLASIVYCLLLIFTLIIFGKFEEMSLQKAAFRYQLKTQTSKDVLINVKKLAIHEGIKFDAVTQKIDGDLAYIKFSFTADEEKENKFNQGLSDIDGILEIKNE